MLEGQPKRSRAESSEGETREVKALKAQLQPRNPMAAIGL